jgi:fatty-acyl-CoA synthase
VHALPRHARYWDNPEATDEAIDEAGWMRTGDLGVMDAAGYPNIVGRIKDMVIRGGRTSTREIEELLFQHPAVASVQGSACPMPHGRRAHGVDRAADGAEVTDDELRAFCRERVAHFKVRGTSRSRLTSP